VPGTEPREGVEGTSERVIRREEGTDGGEGEVSANKGEEKQQMGRKETTNGGKQLMT